MLFVLTATTFTACNNAETPAVKEEVSKPFDMANAKTEIEDANRVFMELVAKGDSAGLAGLYATEAKVMFPEAPAVVGKANIQSLFSGMLSSGITKVDLKTNDVFGAGDFLVEDGEVQIYAKDQVVGSEKYLVLWKKEDGKWKLFRDIMNSNAPAPKKSK